LVVDGGAFTERFDGFNQSGLHAEAPTDLDTIQGQNSLYLVPNPATNVPPDYNNGNRGYIRSIFNSGTNGMQILYGRSGGNQYKIWTRAFNTTWDTWVLVVDGNQLDFSNDLMVTNLPTSDPLVSGALWNNGGVVNVSA